MNPFYCVIDLEDRAVDCDALGPAVLAVGQATVSPELSLQHSWGAIWAPSSLGRPAVVHRHGVLAIGDVRITNRASFPARPGQVRRPEADLTLVVDQYHRRGVAGLAELVGDFSFVLWDTRGRRLLAARDALGVKSLFIRRQEGRVAIGSHIECFDAADLDRDAMVGFLAGAPPGAGPTIHRGVERLGAGTYLLVDDQRFETGRHWDAADFAPGQSGLNARDAAEEFRHLFDEAVTVQFDDGACAWSQLSGGLDSSSVVVTAEALARQGRIAGLRGTQTVVDSLSDGDETRYSDLVLARHGLPNVRHTDFGAWQDDGTPPPARGEPRVFLPFYARDRAMRDAVVGGGARILLSGYGADNYLAGSFDHIADLVLSRRFGQAATELVDLAVARRRSVWSMARRHVLAPLAPGWFRGGREPAPWLTLSGTPGAARVAGGGVFAREQALQLAGIDASLERGVFEDGMEMRYPFLHRPLVEFALRLPIALRFRPNRPKWILREAMADRLPEAIRERQGKGGIDGRVVWSFRRERATLRKFVRESRLADLGLVSRGPLAAAVEKAGRGELSSCLSLFRTMSLETWFAVRSGWRSVPANLPVPVPPGNFIREESHHEVDVL